MRVKTKSLIYKLIFVAVILYIVFLILRGVFNLTFSLPTNFKDVVDNTEQTELAVNDIQSIQIRKSGKLSDDRLDYIPPEDDREFTIDDKNQISEYISSDIRLYLQTSVDKLRDRNDEYDLILEYSNGDKADYKVGDGYIIDYDIDGNYKVLGDNNELYENVSNYYKE